MSQTREKPISAWLAVCSTMIFAMVLFGGAVRVTGSGLSMVDWKPLMGVLPPLNHDAWVAYFELYKQFLQEHEIYYVASEHLYMEYI